MGNDAFLEWAKKDWNGWGMCQEEPQISPSMLNTFSAGNPLIQNLEGMENAMRVLFRFRAKAGLEREIMFRIAGLHNVI